MAAVLSIPPPARARIGAIGTDDPLRRQRPVRVALQATSNVVALGAALALAATAPPLVMIVCWGLAGLLLAGCYTAAHECAHGTFARPPWVNAVAGRIWATLALLNFSIYRRFHLQHHARTGRPGDTEEFGWRYLGVGQYVRDLVLSGGEFLLQMSIWSLRTLAGLAFPTFLTRQRERRAAWWDAVLLAGWQAGLLTATVLAPGVALRIIWGPYVAYAAWIFLAGLPEHYGTTPGANPLANTRSVRSNAVFRWLYWSGNLHAEHHLFPAIPAHNLIKVHRLVEHDLQHCEGSLVGFHLGVIRNLAISGARGR